MSVTARYKKPLATFGLLMMVLTLTAMNTAFACKPHWIKGLYEDKQVVQLDDDTLWQVKDICSAHVKHVQWEQGTNVLLCHEDQKVLKLKNIDVPEKEQEWVFVQPISSVESAPDSCPHLKDQ